MEADHFKAAAVEKKLTSEIFVPSFTFFFHFVSQLQEMRTFFWLSMPESHLLYISLSIYKNMLKHLEMFVSERYLFCIGVSEL